MDSAVAEGEDATTDATPRRRRIGAVAVIALVVVVVDQASKHWALNRLSDGRTVEVVGSLQFALTWNTGASFSLGEGRNIGPLVGLLALGIVAWLLQAGYSRTWLGTVAAGLVAGGAVGNLVDRAFRSGPNGLPAGFMGGAVVDFVDVGWWPVFNVADSAVVIGAILLVLATLRDGGEA